MLKCASAPRWRADGGTAQSALSKVRALSAAGQQRREQKQDSAGPSSASMKEALMVPPRKRFGQRMGQFEDAERKPKVRRFVQLASCNVHLLTSPSWSPLKLS